MKTENENNPRRIEININEKVAEGKYSNLQMVTHGPGEFILDFCQLLPGLPKANVVSRLILSPQHAKALMKTLTANISRYEEHFGQIRESSGSDQHQLSFHPENEKIPN
ncbi:MAG: DUF3467 domain-containing protein [Candidatus Neomarinimicrobiota bacterium]|jgi:hypothetical protein|nr:DUF3467 domain-containing protein [Candidatus Neomarinimicrobiota bacterium]MDD3965498.1 DUF3467 domain-containing protein [Candidatus Neomarinimicrobiota bacterium]MDX9780150.1 DUF3467 domain-containing protein [bacterium]